MNTILKICSIVILFSSHSLVTIINVPADQPTIQDGIDAATDGDTVLVQPGTYDEHTDFNGKNIVVGSLFLTTGNASYISNTVIGGNVWGSVVQFSRGEDSTAILCGFTLTGAQRFGGIDIGGSGPTLMNLIISGNTSYPSYSGGITCKEGGYPTLVNVTISRNTMHPVGGGGGGIFCLDSRMTLVNVTISGNSRHGIFGGGGINCWDSEINLVNVTIVGNTTNSGGGIGCLGLSEVNLVNTIVWNNSPEDISVFLDTTVNVFYSNVQGGWSGIGNIDAYPMFVDTANGNFRLQEGSPCIDEGIQDTFIVYNYGQDTLYIPPLDYVGSAPDMGAYEYGNPHLAIEREMMLVPSSYSLHQNYPNPFNPSTTIEYYLPNPSYVRIEVYNSAGQKIRTLLNKTMQTGSHQVEFNAQNLSSGVYFYKIEAGEFQDVKKMILIK